MNLWLELFALCSMSALTNLGGGFSFVAVIEGTAVREKGWLTGGELADVVSLGVLVPGMLAINVTAVLGYKVAGPLGVTAAVGGTLFPTLVLALPVAFLRDRLRENQIFSRIRESLGPAALVVMALTVHALARDGLRSGEDLVIAAGAVLLTGVLKLHPAVVLLLGGLWGLGGALLSP